jgi:hypothetical protein
LPTRSELYHQENTVDEPQETVSHHIGLRVLGVVLLTVLTISFIVERTILNKSFVMHEVTSSALESTILDEVDDGLQQYGIPTSAVTKADTDHIVRTVVNQAFAGQRLKLDMSPITNNVENQANGELSKFGLSTDLLPSGTSSAVTSQVNSAVNSQINTPEVTAIINGLQVARVVTNICLIVSAIGLLVLIALAILRRHFVASFSWIFLLGTVISWLVIEVVRATIPQLAHPYPDYSTFAVQCAGDFVQTAMPVIAITGILAVICWVIRGIKKFK